MKDKLFLDSNIILYAFGEKGHEKEIAKDLIRKRPLITIQVVNEIINVLLRKFNFSVDKTKEILNFLKFKTEIRLLNLQTIDSALHIKEKYKYSFWDSLIIASALENECLILYTEDLQHEQVIEGKLKIINPFEKQGQRRNK